MESQRLTVESALIRKVSYFNNVQSSLEADVLSSESISKSKPDILSKSLELVPLACVGFLLMNYKFFFYLYSACVQFKGL